MPLPLVTVPFRYLIGGSDNASIKPGACYELSYDATRGDTAYCNLRDEKGRYSSLEDANARGRYSPYLPPDDVTAAYGEYCPDPRGDGYLRNIYVQLDRAATYADRVEFDNPDTTYLELADVLVAHDRAQDIGMTTIAKNPLLVSDPVLYVSHSSVDMIVCERDARHTANVLDQLRRTIGQPHLAVRFVAFGGGRAWAERVAQDIGENDYLNMGVTYSQGGEYTDCIDLAVPVDPTAGATPMKIVMSSGHGKYIRGASGSSCGSWGLDEVDQARRVVEQSATMMRHLGADVTTFHDNTSHDQNTNLNTIVNFHNSQKRDVDISVHFNAYQCTSKAMGVEVLYVTQQTLAADISAAIADAGHFLDRGPKKRTDLFFLNNTQEPAVLIETCFCDSSTDAELYNQGFDVICQAIAEAVTGQEAGTPPPEGERPPVGLPPTPSEDKPVLGEGDEGVYVEELQADLNDELENCDLDVDGDFGNLTDEAVRDYQRSRGLDVDGIVGEQTWNALDTHMPPYVPAGLPPPLTDAEQDEIATIAINSNIARYSWRDRGMAPDGYIKGFALSYANTYRQYLMGYRPAVEMAKANSGDSSTDVLQWYYTQYRDAHLDNTRDGPDTLRHLWALLLGLGMRESSGKHCEGKDQSAENTTSDTCEAGLFQTSYNAHSSDATFDELFDTFSAAVNDNPQGFLDYFEEDVECSSSSWENYGSGKGAQFQEMCKIQPAFACETCAIVLRKLRQHYGPINREEAELKTDADKMLKAVQDYIDDMMTGEV
jgi:N-acetylmuramoyl-L-alanine amidase